MFSGALKAMSLRATEYSILLMTQFSFSEVSAQFMRRFDFIHLVQSGNAFPLFKLRVCA